ncbi:MAG: hypothetical protein Q9220_004156 [cf. Caloplaca sp. 1 TL-2023]
MADKYRASKEFDEWDSIVNDCIMSEDATRDGQPVVFSFSKNIISSNDRMGLQKFKEIELAAPLLAYKHAYFLRSWRQTGLPVPSRLIAGEPISDDNLPPSAFQPANLSNLGILTGQDYMLRKLAAIQSTKSSRRDARQNTNKVLPQACVVPHIYPTAIFRIYTKLTIALEQWLQGLSDSVRQLFESMFPALAFTSAAKNWAFEFVPFSKRQPIYQLEEHKILIERLLIEHKRKLVSIFRELRRRDRQEKMKSYHGSSKSLSQKV